MGSEDNVYFYFIMADEADTTGYYQLAATPTGLAFRRYYTAGGNKTYWSIS